MFATTRVSFVSFAKPADEKNNANPRITTINATKDLFLDIMFPISLGKALAYFTEPAPGKL
jgi:hypothetical protein